MLPFLVPSSSAARASTQLARKLLMSTKRQLHLARRHTSTFVGHSSPTARNEQTDDDFDDASQLRHQRTDSDTFSHFFDRRAFIPQTTLSSGKLKASYEIAAASRHATYNFRQAVGSRDPTQIIAVYENLIRAHQRHADDVSDSSSHTVGPSDIGFPVRKADIQTAIRYLIQHAQREGSMEWRYVEACQQMFQDMSQTFGFRIGPTDLHRQLQACCLAERSRIDPRVAFRQLRADYPDWRTTSVEWNIVISHFAQRKLYAQAIKVWQEMQKLGVEAEAALHNTMIRVLTVNNAKEAEAHLHHLKQKQGELGIDTLTTAVEGLCKLISTGRAKDREATMSKLQSYASQLRQAIEALPSDAMEPSAWHTLLRYEAEVLGPTQALETARQASRSGVATSTTLNVLLRAHVEEIRELQSSDEALELLDRVQSAIDPRRGVQPDDRCYNVLMLGLLDDLYAETALFDGDANFFAADEAAARRCDRLLRTQPTPNQIREAQLLYDHVRSLSIPATPLLVTPLLQAYCEAFLPSLPSAMKLLKDMLDDRSSALSISARKNSASSRRRPAQPLMIGVKIIQLVLDACVRLRDISSACNLLARLLDAGVPISATHKTDVIGRLMGITTSWTEAFHVYRLLSRFPTTSSSGRSTGLDERGYITTLENFRSLSFPSSTESDTSVAPPEHLLAILADMRIAGYRPTPSIYTTILDYYSKTPTPSYLGVKATHEALQADIALEPDLPLMNALMNAYNRAEEPVMVLAIWDSLLATRQDIDGITLGVVLDTCGRFGLLSVARKALATVRRLEEDEGKRGRSAMTKGAWDSWLECLARCGRLEEAIELVFGEMRRSLFREAISLHDLDLIEEVSVTELIVRSTQAPIRDTRGNIIGPDSKTLSTLLKFAARERDRRQKRFTSSNRSTSIWHTLRNRIREELSWIYPQVKAIGESTSL
ncbi:uncharacterized protein UBRO_01087 [Ustilago bromivora]|uniref:Uncharacterized protein n=1 Tax=Ustilago bromivora TaxID=307758 RepID=A0A1K0GGW5_9BASI|nr:uncharacterized protein UBRO_01087 [Ustilago bromivora]SYW77805.1 uncharacterized protein UBRO2_01997 [Ustilago bromivora]